MNSPGQHPLEVASRSVEFQLLLLCARRNVAPAARHRIQKLVEQGVDWEEFTRLARRHRLSAFADRRISEGVLSGVSPASRQTLAGDRQRNTLRNLRLAAELITILRALADAQIPAIPYKGPILTEDLYGSLALRPMADLDVVIHPHDLDRVGEILAPLGYGVSHTLSPLGVKYMLATKHHLAWRDPDRDLMVEVHWSFAPRIQGFHPTVDALFNRCRRRLWNEVPILSIPDPELLVILAVHGAGHCWQALELLTMFGELVAQRPQLDWTNARAFAGRHGVERHLNLGLQLAADLLGVELPAPEIAVARADRAAARLAVAAGWFLTDHTGKHYFREIRFHMALAASFRRKTAILICGVGEHLIFPLIYPAPGSGRFRSLCRAVTRPFGFFWRRLAGHPD